MENEFDVLKATEEAKMWAEELPTATYNSDTSNYNRNSNDGYSIAISEQEMRQNAMEFARGLKSK